MGVTAGTQNQSEFEVAAGRSVHLEIPADFSNEHIELALKDLDILKDILGKCPSEFKQIVSAIEAGNFKDAQAIAKTVGISEEAIIQRGGGLWGLVIVIAIGAALLLAHD